LILIKQIRPSATLGQLGNARDPSRGTVASPSAYSQHFVRMDSYEVTRQIKADPAMRSIPIIAVTSHALYGEEQTARAAGCDGYVPEPYSPRDLLAKIRQYLQMLPPPLPNTNCAITWCEFCNLTL
jgi:DNA-binding NarL/FixJ family response regulator